MSRTTTGSQVRIKKLILDKYHHEDVKDYPPIHPVDILSIATRSNPVPLKDVDDKLLKKFDGRYLGATPLAKALKRDLYTCTIGTKRVRVSRWMMLDVDEESRNASFDDIMQHYMTHGAATVKVGPLFSINPSEEMNQAQIIAVRKYSNLSAAVVNLADSFHYGAHRCNLAQDGELGE